MSCGRKIGPFDCCSVVQGDCLELMKQLPDGCVDAVITDPPYGMDYQSAWRTDKAQWKPKIANDKRPFIWFLYDAYRITRDGGAVLSFCDWARQDVFKMAIDAAGYAVRSHIIWDREAHGMGDLKACFAPQHDVVWFGTKGEFAFPGERPKSVIHAQRLGGEELTHPNEKPIDAMVQLVEAVTLPGDVVVDTFGGSGVTGEAAKQLGRHFLIFELSPEYCEIARKRIALVEAQPNLFEPKAEQLTLAPQR